MSETVPLTEFTRGILMTRPRSISGALEEVFCLRDELCLFHSRCVCVKLRDQMTAEGDAHISSLDVRVWVFFHFTYIKLCLTLTSGPQGVLSSGQQVQGHRSPAAALYLLARHCYSRNKTQKSTPWRKAPDIYLMSRSQSNKCTA